MSTRLVANEIWKLGTHYINWYLIRQSDAFTLVDTGLPRYWSQLEALLRDLRANPQQIRAVVVTHHHPDHRGNIARASNAATARVYAHSSDYAYLRGDEKLRPRRLYRFLWRPWYMKYFAHLVANGVTRAQFLEDLREMTDGERLEIPGMPTIVHAPGHTPGSCALFLPHRNVLFSGDALVTLDTSTGYKGPSVIRGPVTHDAELARRSLDRLEQIPADIMLPGHGEPWTQGIRQAALRARARVTDG